MKILNHAILSCIAILSLAALSGCSKSSSTEVVNVVVTETPFVFHKPQLGATFTVHAQGSGDSTYIFTVTDTNVTIGGKSGALQFDGYYKPFFVNYRPSGDIDIAGDFDYLFGRDSWTWFPLATEMGKGAEAYSHDSLISNPDPQDTRKVERDTMIVLGKETLVIKGQSIECIKAERRLFLQLTNLKYPIKTSSTFTVLYWYAPSLGYWAKEQINDKGFNLTFTLIDFTL